MKKATKKPKELIADTAGPAPKEKICYLDVPIKEFRVVGPTREDKKTRRGYCYCIGNGGAFPHQDRQHAR